MSPRPAPQRSALAGAHPAIPAEARPAAPPAEPVEALALKPPLPATVETEPLPATVPAVTSGDEAPRRAKMTINIDAELQEAAKDAFWLDHGGYRTFSSWVEDALRAKIEAAKAAHGVTEIPPRPGGGGPLPTGRPLSPPRQASR